MPPANAGAGEGAQLAFVVSGESSEAAAVFVAMLGSAVGAELLGNGTLDYSGIFEIGAALSAAKTESGADFGALIADLAASFIARNKESVAALVDGGATLESIRDSLQTATNAAMAPATIAQAVQSGTFSISQVASAAKKSVAASSPSLAIDVVGSVAADQAVKGGAGLVFAQAHVVQTKLVEILAKGGDAAAAAAVRESLWSAVKTLDADDLDTALSSPSGSGSKLDDLVKELAAAVGDTNKLAEAIAAGAECKDPKGLNDLLTKDACEKAGATWRIETRTDDCEKAVGLQSCATSEHEWCDLKPLLGTEASCKSYCGGFWSAGKMATGDGGSGDSGSGDSGSGDSGSGDSGSGDGATDGAGEAASSEDEKMVALTQGAAGDEGYCKIGGTGGSESDATIDTDTSAKEVPASEDESSSDGTDDNVQDDASMIKTTDKCSTVGLTDVVKNLTCSKDTLEMTCHDQYAESIGGNWIDLDDGMCGMTR